MGPPILFQGEPRSMGPPIYFMASRSQDAISFKAPRHWDAIFFMVTRPRDVQVLYLAHLNTRTLDKNNLLSHKIKIIRLGHCTWQGGGSTHIRLFAAIRPAKFIVVEGHNKQELNLHILCGFKPSQLIVAEGHNI